MRVLCSSSPCPEKRTAEQIGQWALPRLLVTLSALLLLASAVLPALPATAQVRLPRAERRQGLSNALKATVLVLVPDNNGDLFDSGSGTVMDAEKGTILTNYHVMGDRQQKTLYNDDGSAIIGLMPDDLRGSPILKYRATLIGGDPDLDLAVLQINGLLDDPRAELPRNLGLTAIQRGNSDNLMIGDTLYVIGYPGLGGNTVTMSAGLVSGFLDQNNDNVFEWIKTDAEVNRGNSGGLAVNEEWQFVGVPSRGVSEVETAGKISLIRAGNLALTYYEAVLAGNAGSQSADAPRVLKVDFGDAVNRGNDVTRPQTHFDSGITDLYAAFEFAGFHNGQQLDAVWYVDGQQVNTDHYTWKEGEQGRSWVSLYQEKGLVDGFYELELILDGQSLYRGGVTVGEAQQPPTACHFGEITFAAGISDQGEPVDPGTRFGNLKTVYAFFPVSGVSNGISWTSAWFFEGQSVSQRDDLWDLGDIATQWVSLSHADGLPAGHFKLELTCGGIPQQSGEFQVIGRVDPQAEGVNVTGTVTDRDNKRRRIEGALVIFLQQGVTISEWVNADFSEAMVHGRGTTDGKGAYRLDAKVMPGAAYSVVAIHDDYTPAGEDAYTIPTDAGDPFELNITMEQK